MGEREARDAGDAPLAEPGPHLSSLRVLWLRTYRGDDVLATIVDARRRLVEPLRAATAFTALDFLERGGTAKLPASFLLLTVNCIDDLVAGKPALREFCACQEILLEDELAHLPALRARHPRVAFEFDIDAANPDRHLFRLPLFFHTFTSIRPLPVEWLTPRRRLHLHSTVSSRAPTARGAAHAATTSSAARSARGTSSRRSARRRPAPSATEMRTAAASKSA